MQNTNLVENMIPQSQLTEEQENGFLLPEQLIQMAYAKLEYLKALYRKQLGFDKVASVSAAEAYGAVC